MTDTHNWQPLIAIADAAGGNWPAAALALAGKAAAEAEADVSPGVACFATSYDSFRRRERTAW